MKISLFFFVLLNVTALMADSSSEPKERPRVTDKIKLDFKKLERKMSSETHATSESDLDVVELDSFQVFADYRYFVFDSENAFWRRNRIPGRMKERSRGTLENE